MIDWERGLATCQHCGEVIQIHTYKKSNTEKVYTKPVWENKTNLSDNLIKYFENRKISQNTLKTLMISEGKEKMPPDRKEFNTVQFNYFRDSELINVKYRTGDKRFKMVSGAELVFYNLDFIRCSKEVIICEGEFDCLSFVEAGFLNSTSVPNGATAKGNINLTYLDNCLDYFDNKEKIYIATDNDEAGRVLEKELIRRLDVARCYKVDFKDCKDANEYLIKYGKDELKLTIENSKQYPLENISKANDYLEQLYDFYDNGTPKGFQIGLNSFDEHFSLYTGMCLVVTGIPNMGKSDFVDMMCCGYNRNYDWKIAYASIENEPRELHIDKLLRKIIGYKPQRHNFESDSFKLGMQRIQDYFYFIEFSNGYDLEKILQKGEELVKREGIKCLVIDPFNRVRLKASLSKGINDYTNDYLNLVEDFAKKNDVLVIVVAHPVKMQKNKDTNKYNIPDFYDVKGGGEFFDMAHFGLAVHRDYDNNYVTIKNLKVKFAHLGETQKETFLMWNSKNGRYSNVEGSLETCFHPLHDNSHWITGEMNNEFAYEIPRVLNTIEEQKYAEDDCPF